METEITAEQILGDITSGDGKRVWQAAGDIINSIHNRELMLQLVPHKETILQKTTGIKLGGMLLDNNRLVEFSIEILDFYANDGGCPCELYLKTGEDTFYNPKRLAEQGVAEIIRTVGGNFPDFYIVQCKCCGQKFKVETGMYHYTWYKWYKYN